MMHLSLIRSSLLVVALALASPGLAGEGPPDAWLTTKAKIAILTSIGTAGTDINVDTVEGRVSLHGTVVSEEYKKSAGAVARDIDGVKEVRNLLAVVPQKQAEEIEASDFRIGAQVETELEKDEALRESEIKVQSVNNGTVLLAGEADSQLAHLRAIEVARKIEGVRRVASEIRSPDQAADAEIWSELDTIGVDAAALKAEVSGAAADAAEGAKDAASAAAGSASDAYITMAAKKRLLVDAETPGMDINVDTEEGVVTLFGTVPSEEARMKAEEHARHVSGVRQVRNELEVRMEPESTDPGKE